MEIKRPSHICAGAVFEFAAIFWNLFEKFLQKAFFKHALAVRYVNHKYIVIGEKYE